MTTICNRQGKYIECHHCGHRQGHDCSAEISTEEIFVVTGYYQHEPMYNQCRGRCVELNNKLCHG